jgi:dTDP-4-dehydrorhamnose reductase
MVFDGEHAPYAEEQSPAPLTSYGRSKAAAEAAIQELDDRLIVRLPLMYGMPVSPRRTTFAAQIDSIRRGEPMPLFVDEFRTPIALADAAAAIVALARSGRTGVIHVAGPERVSRLELIDRAARALGLTPGRLDGVSRLDVPSPEPRPADLSLVGERFLREFPACRPGRIEESLRT